MRSLVPILIPLVGAAIGCAADNGDEGIFVIKNVAPSNGACEFTGDENEPFVAHGALDIATPAPYLFVAQMKSRVTAEEGQEDARTIITSHANVDITFPANPELADLEGVDGLTHFKSLFTAPLVPNGGVTDAGFTLIPAAVGQELAARGITGPVEAVGTFTIIGDMSGAEQTSNQFSFGVTLGKNIVINVLGTCDTVPMSFTGRQGNACNFAQDGIVDCCTRTDGSLACPAVGTMPST
ncbi:MAG TPA: hypothetical protein VFQ53_43480 [Kofleriaceae bacterium]|nr:hypothetical protein [Kofleriaceae bacterium]